MAVELPPDPLPPLPEPDGKIGVYAYSGLRSVCGTQVNPEAWDVYGERTWAIAPDCPVRTCVHPDIGMWINDVGGFDARLRLQQPELDSWPMPRLIPRVRMSRSFPPYPIPAGWYAIDYQDLNGSVSHLPQREWLGDVRSKFPEGSRLILDFFGEHRLVESIWQFGSEFWQHPFLDQFDAVVIPDFSTFINDPKPQALIGERMKQMFAQDGHNHGRTIIPSIAWAFESGLQRQADLLGSLWPHVNTILIDVLGANVDRTTWLWSRLEMLHKYIAPLPQRFLLAGASSGWAVAELHEVFPRQNFHLLHVGPFTNALRSEAPQRERTELFVRECRQIEDWCRGDHLPQKTVKPPIPPDLRMR